MNTIHSLDSAETVIKRQILIGRDRLRIMLSDISLEAF